MKKTMKALLEASHAELRNVIYNSWVSDFADHNYGEHKGEVRIPYIGAYWRSTDFVGKHITIGEKKDFIGVMENNTLNFPERPMTEDEVDTFMSYLERAFAAHNAGGDILVTAANADTIFEECYDWFQTLVI